MIFLITIALIGAIDNFLFKDKEIYQLCIKEIEKKQNAKLGECYSY